jgi:hypothetical protein
LRWYDYTPDKFLEFLISQKLNENLKILKLAACYSNEFAEKLSTICVTAFPQLTVIGYRNQLLIGQGHSGNIIAGLDVPLVKEEKTEAERKEGVPGRWVLNQDKFSLNEENYKTEYDEGRQQIKFRRGVELEEKQDNTSAPVNNNASQRLIASS